MNDYLTLAAMAEQYGEAKSNTLRAMRRWENEVGPRSVKARAGGKQRQCLLSRDDFAEFQAWRNDFPMPATNGGAASVSLASRLTAVARELADIAAALAEHS
jgi:hypothetical protein